MAKEKQAGEGKTTIKDLEKIVLSLAEDIKALKERVVPMTATEQIDEVINEVAKPIEAAPVSGESDVTVQKRFVNPEYRKVINEVLGEQFEAWETYDETPATHFKLYIVVPMAISSISSEERARGQNTDVRPKAISYAEGVNGVREWCLKVRNNLSRYYANTGIRSPFINQL